MLHSVMPCYAIFGRAMRDNVEWNVKIRNTLLRGLWLRLCETLRFCLPGVCDNCLFYLFFPVEWKSGSAGILIRVLLCSHSTEVPPLHAIQTRAAFADLHWNLTEVHCPNLLQATSNCEGRRENLTLDVFPWLFASHCLCWWGRNVKTQILFCLQGV